MPRPTKIKRTCSSFLVLTSLLQNVGIGFLKEDQKAMFSVDELWESFSLSRVPAVHQQLSPRTTSFLVTPSHCSRNTRSHLQAWCFGLWRLTLHWLFSVTFPCGCISENQATELREGTPQNTSPGFPHFGIRDVDTGCGAV